MNSGLKWGFVLLVVAVTLLFVVVVASNPAEPFPAPPVPNGYDDFVAAGKLVTGDVDFVRETKLELFRTFVATNAEALRLLQLGLSRTSTVPLATFVTNQSQMVADLGTIKRLAQFNVTVGRLAELEGRTNEALTIYLQGLRLAREANRGGVWIHDLVATACESIAFNLLTNLAVKIPPVENRAIIAGLEQVDATTISWEEMMKSERLFNRHTSSSYGNPIDWIRGWWTNRAALKKGKLKHLRCIVQRRQLLAELALRRYVAEQGKAPQRLSELVPGYLSRLPENPATKQPPDYYPQGTNWVLEFKL